MYRHTPSKIIYCKLLSGAIVQQHLQTMKEHPAIQNTMFMKHDGSNRDNMLMIRRYFLQAMIRKYNLPLEL